MQPANPPTFTLRPPTLADLPAVVAMLNACWLDTVGTTSFSEAGLRAQWAQPGVEYTQDVCLAVDASGVIGYCAATCRPPYVFFLALDGDQIAGLALCFPKDTDYPDMCWVQSLGVRRPWRRRGLALALLHHVFGECYRRGIYKVGLGVDADSLTNATRLYERAGMQIFRQWDNYEKVIRAGQDLVTHTIAD